MNLGSSGIDLPSLLHKDRCGFEQSCFQHRGTMTMAKKGTPQLSSTGSLRFDPLSASFARDPYAVYHRLRDQEKLHYFEHQDMYLLSRYEDVATVATSPYAVRSLAGIASPEEIARLQRQANWHNMPYHERVVQFSLLDSDGDVHRRLRTQIFATFRNDSVFHLEPFVQSHIDHLLDELEGRKTIDFVQDFAAHVPGFVIGHLLGAPTEDCTQLRLWSEQIVQFFDVDRSDDKKQLAERATHEFYDYLTALKIQRYADPQDDLISRMIVDEQTGGYSQDEFISTCMLILMAGHGSTIDVLGSGMHTLLKHPHALRDLRQNPSKLPVAIQEMFRYEPPLPFFHRHITRDMTIRGQTFPEGTTFGLLYGAANRDPAHFPEADRFKIERTPNRHLAFGLGAHLCLGNHLARFNMKLIFETLLKRYANIELMHDEVTYKPGLSVRGPVKLDIELARA
jgi:cytochrome P450